MTKKARKVAHTRSHHSSSRSFVIHPVGHSSFVIRHSSFVIRHSSFVIRHSSFVIRHSSFVIRHSSFVIRHSSFMQLGVNIDHVATLRQARYAGPVESHNAEPCLLAAASAC